jgi:hypothetical protein
MRKVFEVVFLVAILIVCAIIVAGEFGAFAKATGDSVIVREVSLQKLGKVTGDQGELLFEEYQPLIVLDYDLKERMTLEVTIRAIDVSGLPDGWTTKSIIRLHPGKKIDEHFWISTPENITHFYKGEYAIEIRKAPIFSSLIKY